MYFLFFTSAKLSSSSKKKARSRETDTKDLLDGRKFLLDYCRQVELAERMIIGQNNQDDQG